ncbi:hypothetical protein BDV96DRAFT_602294 [Lophiotrema nucula]|uniref:Uncharacterized protein n=1 Tax=Lophiotrema nucula TaxID=690887 RepID=A0A6A5YYY2_9PLEO|nr:hypothetical protein BDV96DRAFT_602294 [Lophiotrema nucula]
MFRRAICDALRVNVKPRSAAPQWTGWRSKFGSSHGSAWVASGRLHKMIFASKRALARNIIGRQTPDPISGRQRCPCSTSSFSSDLNPPVHALLPADQSLSFGATFAGDIVHPDLLLLLVSCCSLRYQQGLPEALGTVERRRTLSVRPHARREPAGAAQDRQLPVKYSWRLEAAIALCIRPRPIDKLDVRHMSTESVVHEPPRVPASPLPSPPRTRWAPAAITGSVGVIHSTPELIHSLS